MAEDIGAARAAEARGELPEARRLYERAAVVAVTEARSSSLKRSAWAEEISSVYKSIKSLRSLGTPLSLGPLASAPSSPAPAAALLGTRVASMVVRKRQPAPARGAAGTPGRVGVRRVRVASVRVARTGSAPPQSPAPLGALQGEQGVPLQEGAGGAPPHPSEDKEDALLLSPVVLEQVRRELRQTDEAERASLALAHEATQQQLEHATERLQRVESAMQGILSNSPQTGETTQRREQLRAAVRVPNPARAPRAAMPCAPRSPCRPRCMMPSQTAAGRQRGIAVLTAPAPRPP